jgi:simple sugar transport system ATP-binding protein
MRNITKAFSGVLANDRVSLEVSAGEVHALLGENGAGKSTLMNILYGLYTPQEGQIIVNDKEVVIDSPRKAIELGIGMVHQHFMLIPALTVLENIVMGLPPQRGPFLDIDKAARQIEDMSDRFGLEVDPFAETGQLSVGVQQRVEILKALYRQANILILDEPTAVLTPQEATDLFRILRELAEQGYSIIFVSHKLEEVRQICDRATVLRDGKNVSTVDCADVTSEELATMMVGREVVLQLDKGPASVGPPVLEVEDLKVDKSRGLPAVQGISFAVHQGEILGVAGVDGNGQEELVEAIAGLRPVRSGRIRITGQDITHSKIRSRFRLGIGHIPEDRHRLGLILDFNLSGNLILRRFDSTPFNRWGFLQSSTIQEFSKRLLAEFDVRSPGPGVRAKTLSGGNQQKLVLAREMESHPAFLLASKPTRGLDVGAIEFVRRRLIEERDRGMGILLISTDLEEIMALSDRILVFFNGRIAGEQKGETADIGTLGLMMAGAFNAQAENPK